MVKKKTIEKLIEESGMSERELRVILTAGNSQDKAVKTYQHHYSPNHVKILATGDSHIGHKCFIEPLFCKMLDAAKKEHVEAIYHAGDLLEGMSGRDGHIYELQHIGANAQMDYASQLLNLTDKPFYMITGNHDEWLLKKGNNGTNIGEILDKEIPQFHYLGLSEADIELAPGITMKMIHPGDGGAYAVSYKIQKRMESFEGGHKPNILLQGHYHKALYLFYRNIHAWEVGTTCGQTPYFRAKNLSAHKGFWILDLYYDKKGIDKVEQKFYPDYD